MDDVLFSHQLNIDFMLLYEMPQEEADRFSESFGHFHKVMTDQNSSPMRNAIFLNENFFDLWNNMTPQEMLNKCLENAFLMSAHQAINTKNI